MSSPFARRTKIVGNGTASIIQPIDAVTKWFHVLYQATWSGADVPVTFQIGSAGQSAQPAKFLINQAVVKISSEWRIASILPIPPATLTRACG
jgi:hypothetical protein